MHTLCHPLHSGSVFPLFSLPLLHQCAPPPCLLCSPLSLLVWLPRSVCLCCSSPCLVALPGAHVAHTLLSHPLAPPRTRVSHFRTTWTVPCAVGWSRPCCHPRSGHLPVVSALVEYVGTLSREPPPPPLLLSQCLRLTAKFLLRCFRCQEDLRLTVFGLPSTGTTGGPWEEGGPSQTLPPPPFGPPPFPPFNTPLVCPLAFLLRHPECLHGQGNAPSAPRSWRYGHTSSGG